MKVIRIADCEEKDLFFCCNDAVELNGKLYYNTGLTGEELFPAPKGTIFNTIEGNHLTNVTTFFELIGLEDCYKIGVNIIEWWKYRVSDSNLARIRHDIESRFEYGLKGIKPIFCAPFVEIDGDRTYVGLLDYNAGDVVRRSVLWDATFDIEEYLAYRDLIKSKIST